MYVACKVCDRGTLVSRKKRRMSGPVVFIGFILLIPSVASTILFSAVALECILGTKPGGGSGIAFGVAAGLALASFVGGLLGWLLVMKKNVLQCTHCSAVVNAS